MVDLHRHDEYSTFDGFGKPSELAKIAKEKGHTSLGIANHGNTNGFVKHFFACKEEGIKPILGLEGYFLPKHIPQNRGYHLCLFVKNKKGYENLNKIQFEGEKQKYYNSIIDFKILEQYSEGIICTSACIAGYLAQCILQDDFVKAKKYLNKMQSIFNDDFYVEIQPYNLDGNDKQEKINYHSIRLAKQLGIKCILTSDSHRGNNEDLPTYLKMHEVAGHNMEHIETTYSERYMPTEKEIIDRFIVMHSKSLTKHKQYCINGTLVIAKEMIKNLEEIENKVDDDILENRDAGLPKFDKNKNSLELLKSEIIKGLKRRGKYKTEYVNRAKTELNVIKYHGFEDYFLIVADYTMWAKNNGIAVGPGRGSGCNCLVNYALGITDVDPIFFNLDFNRFLRIDKNKMPDIDLDFETKRRPEVIAYIVNKYPNNAAQICNYGLYKVDNLINDLAKVCGVNEKSEIVNIKKFVKGFIKESVFDFDGFKKHAEYKVYNKLYDDILLHFSKLYEKVRFIGTHAAGVALTKDNILNHVCVKTDSKNGKHYTAYDLVDLEQINVIKFDILGLTTMSSIGELRRLTNNDGFNENWINDKKLLKEFNEGNCDGIFQFEQKAAQDLLTTVHTDSFNDIVATSAMNRPGPLSLKMPNLYADNKLNKKDLNNDLAYAEYIEDTYGCVIYQEQILNIAVNIGKLSWPEADKITKMARGGTEKAIKNFEENYDKFVKKFIKGAAEFGMTKEQSFDIFDTFFNYSFNKGHATGYSMITLEEMYYKVYHTALFWYVKMKYCGDEAKLMKFKTKAINDDIVIFLPHVNYTSEFSIRKMEDEYVIQEGLSSIKGIGEKAAEFIHNERMKNGPFVSFDDFYDRCKNRAVHKGVIETLIKQGALEFNKKAYLSRVVKYNSSLVGRN